MERGLNFFKKRIFELVTITKFVGIWADKYMLECYAIQKEFSFSHTGLHLMEEDVNVFQTTFFNNYPDQDKLIQSTESGVSTSDEQKYKK